MTHCRYDNTTKEELKQRKMFWWWRYSNFQCIWFSRKQFSIKAYEQLFGNADYLLDPEKIPKREHRNMFIDADE